MALGTYLSTWLERSDIEKHVLEQSLSGNAQLSWNDKKYQYLWLKPVEWTLDMFVQVIEVLKNTAKQRQERKDRFELSQLLWIAPDQFATHRTSYLEIMFSDAEGLVHQTRSSGSPN